MNDEKNLISAGLRIVNRHKRYIFWFWLLNLALAWFGSIAFRDTAGATLDHSLVADRLLHGFDLPVLLEFMSRPETGPMSEPTKAAAHFGFVFFFLTLIFLPGVLEGYTNEGRLSRDEFFRVCGRNFWRFVRIFVVFAILAAVIVSLLMPAEHGLVRLARKSTNELLPFYTEIAIALFSFLVMSTLRIWFDLAQLDVVFRDQPAVRKSLRSGFRYTFRRLPWLLGSYFVIAVVTLLVLMAGVWIWHVAVPSHSVGGAFVVSQVMAILFLWTRFWQRGTSAAFYLREMAIALPPSVPSPPVVPLVPAPVPPETPTGGENLA